MINKSKIANNLGGKNMKLRMIKMFKVGLALLFLSSCSTGENSIQGKIRIDGSATVAPVTQAVIEEYAYSNRGVEISMSSSGTGGGFKKFVNGETHIQNASRKIKDNEKADAAKKQIEYYEIEIGKDAIVLAVNKQNNWMSDLTTEQLFEIFQEDSKINFWSDLNPAWPNQKINLYIPATDSGTFDYFHSAIMKGKAEIRTDITASQDINVLVTGVEGDVNSLGFFGFSYFQAAEKKIKAVTINQVLPSVESVNNKAYVPLSRGLYIYVNKEKYQEQATQDFVAFYLANAQSLVAEAGYIPLTTEEYEKQKQQLKQ